MIIINNKRNKRKTRIIKENFLMKTGGKGWNQNVQQYMLRLDNFFSVLECVKLLDRNLTYILHMESSSEFPGMVLIFLKHHFDYQEYAK